MDTRVTPADPDTGLPGPQASQRQAGYVAVGLSGLVGSVIAVLADTVQKAEASAVATIAENLNAVVFRTFNHAVIELMELSVMTLLMVLGIALCFIFEVKTKKAALYAGASILALIMTFVPYRSVDPAGTTRPAGSASPSAGLLLLQDTSSPKQVPLEVKTAQPVSELTVVLRERESARIVGRSTFTYLSGTNHEILLDLRALQVDYAITVEAPGHRALTCTFRAAADLRLSVELEAARWFDFRGLIVGNVEPCPASIAAGGGGAG